MKNVIVLGASYGGSRAAQVLAEHLPKEYRIILIDRNSHANHLYVIPRYAVLPGHDHKAFIPYTSIFNSQVNPSSSSSNGTHSSRHTVLQAVVKNIRPDSVTLDRAFPELGLPSTIPYSYAVYALGSHLPAPIDLWAPQLDEKGNEIIEIYKGTKEDGLKWLKRCQERIAKARSVLVVGGGALGIQFATDIASHDPSKQVTLLHSRHRLLPRFDQDLHSEIVKSMEDLQVSVILGERLDLSSIHPENVKHDALGQRIVSTQKGREIAADLLLLCTGQIPNTELLHAMNPTTVDPVTKLASVLPTLQLCSLPSTPRPSTPPTFTLAASVGTSSVTSPTSEYRSSNLQSAFEESVTFSAAAIDASELEEKMKSLVVNEERSNSESEVSTSYPHIFVIGDAADAFGAIKAGHNAYFQGEVAALNIAKLAKRERLSSNCRTPDDRLPSDSEDKVTYIESDDDYENEDLELDEYTPGPPAIKLSLGIGQRSVYEINGNIGRKDEADADDLDAGLVWRFFGVNVTTDEDLWL